jgi:hypothetical protein
MNPRSRRNFLLQGAVVTSTVIGLGSFQRLLTDLDPLPEVDPLPDDPLPDVPVEPPRPTGPGVYYWEDLEPLGHQGAVRMVQSLGGGTLSYPSGDFEIAGFGDEGSAGLFFPPKVVPWGQGSELTRFFLAEDSMTAAQAAKIPTKKLSSNPLKIIQVHKAGHPSSPVRAHGFSVHGRDQAGAGYSGVVFAYNPALKVEDVVAAGVVGSMNSPPGETAAVGVMECPNHLLTGVRADGRNTETGERTSAAGISLANSPGGKLRGCGGSYMGHSHGLTAWQSPNGETWDFVATNNGIPGGGGDQFGHVGTGLNHEQSGNWKHHRPMLGWNTLGDVRLYSNKKNEPRALLEDVVKLDGARMVVRLDKKQTTKPTLVRCPAVTWV